MLEFVLEGYLDKVCDWIFDVVVDVYLKEMLEVCVVCEILVIMNCIVIVGEICGLVMIMKDYIVYFVCMVVKDIGYE